MRRPDVKNAFNDDMYRDLTAALQWAAAQPAEEVACVVVTGEGDYFSSGADLAGGRPDGPSKDAPVGLFMQQLMHYPKVVVAAVNGPAIVLFPKIMGHGPAMEMLLSARKLRVEKAKTTGLVADVFPPATLLAATLGRVRDMLAFPLAEKSITMFKDMIKRNERRQLQEVFESEMTMLDKRFNDGDTATAVMALLAQQAKAKAARRSKL